MKPPVSLAKSFSAYLRKRYRRIFDRADLLSGWESNSVHASGRLDADWLSGKLRRLIRVQDEEKIPPEHLEGLGGAVARRKVPGIPNSKVGDAARISEFRDRNLALIRKLDSDQVDRVREILLQGERDAARVETLRSQIAEVAGITERHADLIATDQVLKLAGNIVQDRQTQAGITQYEWSTSGDERVRPMHAELDGTIQSWAVPPVTNEDGDRNHPGGDYRCRCQAIPIL